MQNNENNVRFKKWYKQYNIVLAFAWLSGFAVIPAIYFIPDNYGVVHIVIVGLFFSMMLVFLAYAFFLHRNNTIRSGAYPQE